MYNLVKHRMAQETNQVISIEDPVEIEEPEFLQVQVNEAAGITYETLLKSTLRHHPDIIIVGEIRDEETAKMVIRGALTGHLIIASVHAKNAEGVVSRLKELGVSLDMLSQTIIGIVFQKLLPQYCQLCEEVVTLVVRTKDRHRSEPFFMMYAQTMSYYLCWAQPLLCKKVNNRCEHLINYSGRC